MTSAEQANPPRRERRPRRPRLRATLEDARGTPTPILDPARMTGSPALRDQRACWVIYRAGLELAAASRVRLPLFSALAGMLIFAVLMLAYFLIKPITGGVIALVLSALVGIGAKSAIRLPMPAAGRERCERAARQMLRCALCPSCAYDLLGTPRDESGLTTCPECGAAWWPFTTRREGPLTADAEGEWSLHNALLSADNLRFVNDDRRWRVPLLAHNPGELADRTGDATQRERLLRADSLAKRATRVERALIGWTMLAISVPVALAVLVFFGAGVFTGTLPLSSITWLHLGMLVAPLVMLGYALREIRGKTTLVRRRARRHLVNESFCPSCAADLIETAPDPDGCTVCRACGAAWRIEQQPSPRGARFLAARGSRHERCEGSPEPGPTSPPRGGPPA